MLAIYRQNQKKEWVLSTVFADNIAGMMWREWFEKGGYQTITKTVNSVSELTDTLSPEEELMSEILAGERSGGLKGVDDE
jgi:hypothetical protein